VLKRQRGVLGVRAAVAEPQVRSFGRSSCLFYSGKAVGAGVGKRGWPPRSLALARRGDHADGSVVACHYVAFNLSVT